MCAGAGVDCGARTPVGHLGLLRRPGLKVRNPPPRTHDRRQVPDPADRARPGRPADSGQPGLTGRDRPAPAGPGRAGLPRLGAS